MDENQHEAGANEALEIRKPDIVELPEDEGPAKGQRLVMSRELRGWLAGLSALVVAAAAVSPLIDATDLTGAATSALSDPVGTAKDAACTAEDQTGGFGGQSIACSFVCPDAPGTISVSVDADDSDAQVSGTADCGDSAHCSGKNSCSGTESRTSSGPGTCSADSDEAIDSGLYVSCSAEVSETVDDELDDVGSDICPVTDPFKVCLQPVCGMFASKQATTCSQVWQKMYETLTPYSVSVAFITGEAGAGLACEGYVCQPFEPICFEVKSSTRCVAP
jgi:hypothetical protein